MPTPRPDRAGSGFTLVELSIVLVVVGLLAGGVMVGRDLIQAAEMRAAVSQMDQLNAAVNTFRLKFNCLPGDCPTATAFLADAPPAVVRNGNGDGYVEGFAGLFTADENGSWDLDFWSVCLGCAEWINGYEQLALAGLFPMAPFDDTTPRLARPGEIYPLLKFQSAGNTNDIAGVGQGGLGYGYMPSYLYVRGGHKLLLGFPYGGGLNPPDARRFDAKLDDGRPYTGRAVVVDPVYTYRIPGSVSGDLTFPCADSAASAYLGTYVLNGGGLPIMRYCEVAIDADF